MVTFLLIYFPMVYWLHLLSLPGLFLGVQAFQKLFSSHCMASILLTRPLNIDPARLEGLHSLSDSELCHEGAPLKPGEQQISWAWGHLPTTQTEMAIKTKVSSCNAFSFLLACFLSWFCELVSCLCHVLYFGW